MSRLLLPTVVFLSILFTACTKKDIPYGFPVSEYAKLTPGNYWIYLEYQVDSNGNGSPGNQYGSGAYYDSVYVEKDTLIGNYTYHKLMQPNGFGLPYYDVTYLRDSLNYEVTSSGRIYFTPIDNGATLYTYSVLYPANTTDSAYRVDYKTGNANEQFATPAGTFTTTAMIVTWTFYPFAIFGNGIHYRHQYIRFAAGVGIVSETLPFYTGLPTYTERKLVRYHVQ